MIVANMCPCCGCEMKSDKKSFWQHVKESQIIAYQGELRFSGVKNIAAELSSGLQDALRERSKEEELNEGTKKKPAFQIRKEKPLKYYSGWDKKDLTGWTPPTCSRPCGTTFTDQASTIRSHTPYDRKAYI